MFIEAINSSKAFAAKFLESAVIFKEHLKDIGRLVKNYDKQSKLLLTAQTIRGPGSGLLTPFSQEMVSDGRQRFGIASWGSFGFVLRFFIPEYIHFLIETKNLSHE